METDEYVASLERTVKSQAAQIAAMREAARTVVGCFPDPCSYLYGRAIDNLKKAAGLEVDDEHI